MKRLPKFQGSGIHWNSPTAAKHYDWRVGDTFQDVDFGIMVWDGEKWVQQNL